MSVEDCRQILKVHIMAAESLGKHKEAFALLEALQSIDDHLRQEKNILRSS